MADVIADIATAWPRWMPVAICAKYIGKTEAAVRSLVQRGDIPSHKPNGTVYFDRLEIDQWMRGGARGSTHRKRTRSAKRNLVPA